MLSVNHLSVSYKDENEDRTVYAVNDLSFVLNKNETLAIVGESGSGKTQAMLAMLGLTHPSAVISGDVQFDNMNLLTVSKKRLAEVRAKRIAMIFQDPMTALNPYLKISTQLTEVLRYHFNVDKKTALDKAVDMLERVSIPDASSRIHNYPHEFSGGMRQRVMIAMALLREPDILIADEPTTALDVTVQLEVLRLIHELSDSFAFSTILITHDLGVVASLSDRVHVMYAGELVEKGDVNAIFNFAQHPYTQGLLKSLPARHALQDKNAELYSIPGQAPIVTDIINSCRFSSRCEKVISQCTKSKPKMNMDAENTSACHLNSKNNNNNDNKVELT